MQISRDGCDPSTDTDIGRIQFKTDYSSSPNEVGSIWVRTNSSAYRTDMRFGVKATAGSEEVGLTIHGTNDGPFVGVGTTNPTQTFHVKAEQDGDYVARITNTEATAGANKARVDAWADIGTTDRRLLLTYGNTGTGVGWVSVGYIQNANVG